MRTLVILILLAVIAVLIGWVQYSGNSQTATLTIDKQAIRRDTRSAERKVRDFVDHRAPEEVPDNQM